MMGFVIYLWSVNEAVAPSQTSRPTLLIELIQYRETINAKQSELPRTKSRTLDKFSRSGSSSGDKTWVEVSGQHVASLLLNSSSVLFCFCSGFQHLWKIDTIC